MEANGKRVVDTADVVCEALSLSRARVYDLVARGVLPRASRGRYDLVACTRAYVEWLREERGDADAQALRRLKVERERLELGIRRRAAERELGEEVIPAHEVGALFAEATQCFYREVLRVPNRLAPQLANDSRPPFVADALNRALRAALKPGYDTGLRRLIKGEEVA